MRQVKASFTGKKTLCALALLGAFSAQAQAQTSSVTIYGRVVAGVDVVSNATNVNGTTGTRWRGASNQWGTSMIGFKGTEDLGGGTNAFFLLESGFGATTGATNGTELFNRRSYVGLQGSAGSVKFGRNLFINNDVWFLDPTGQQWIGTASLVKGRNWPGAANIIEYQTPDLGGFTATLQTSLGEQAGSIKNGRKDGISLAYINNGLELRAIYDVTRDANGRYGTVPTTNAADTIFTNSKELILGGTYKIDKLKMYVGYENLRAPDVAAGLPSKVNHYWIGANYDLTPQLTLIGSVFRVNVNNSGGNANLYMLGANYYLSKRTLLYVGAGSVRNKGNANFALEAGDSTGPGAGKGQNGGYVGVAHSF
ncbi:porin [Herbaspirillum sp. YR522]|uniref:porin n=1 Tax=Herbaspirillum sp. YR522 TaxID=1144342 RepID=UPI00026FB366|nr:porin [Herbaspirillum sp. YR522]EJN07716.1 outer membrane protein (porin) [Herbaspirillum sp. YR522]